MKLYTIITIGSLCGLLQLQSARPLPSTTPLPSENPSLTITRAEHVHHHISMLNGLNLFVGIAPKKATILGITAAGIIAYEAPAGLERSEQSSSRSWIQNILEIGAIGGFVWWLVGDELSVIINFKKDMMSFGEKLKTIETLINQMEDNQEQTTEKIAKIEAAIEDCQGSIVKINGHDKRILGQQIALIASLQDVQRNFDAFNEMKKQLGQPTLSTAHQPQPQPQPKPAAPSLPLQPKNIDQDSDDEDTGGAVAATPAELAFMNKSPNPQKLVDQAASLAHQADRFEHIRKIFKQKTVSAPK